MIQQQHTPQSFHIHQMVSTYTCVQLLHVGYVEVAHIVFADVGKYYLVDSGYPNRLGYLAPYKGTKYHLQEFRDGPEPEGKEELFNYTHSSLRNVVERSFGVLKMKWRILQKIPPYTPEKQAQIICACMALHNFVRTSGIDDKHFGRCDRNENYVPRQAYENQPEPELVEDEEWSCMNGIRDSLANALMDRS
jgi:hypothetical protein